VAVSPPAVRAGGPPGWLPRYDVAMDLDVANLTAHLQMKATWTNRHKTPAHEVVFNAHSHYVVPGNEVGFEAKILEILRMTPSDTLGVSTPALEVTKITLDGKTPEDLAFSYEGDTKTALVVPLPYGVGEGQSVTVTLDITMHLPPKQGRWGQWEGVTCLSNWLPVFAVYDDVVPAPNGPEERTTHIKNWQPTPFIPWHQPFFNEACIYHCRVTLPCDEVVASSGSIVRTTELKDGKKEVEIVAEGIRDFAFLCSKRFQVYEGEVPVQPGVPTPVKVHVVAFPEHEFYAKKMVSIATEAILNYSRWFGPYPWPDFTICEAFFGWNGNECATLVMIDERVFAMPHVGADYVDYLVSHEVCHQWWYNLIGTNGYCETFMDEAMATYLSNRLMDRKHGHDNCLIDYPKGLHWAPNVRRQDYRSYGLYGTLGRGENSPAVQPMPQYGHLVNLFSMCYDKGSRIVGMIEDRLGEESFLDFLRIIYRRYQYRILRVADLQHELEAYTDESWDEFFKYWLYGPGLSDWAIDKVTVSPPPSVARPCRLRPCVKPDGPCKLGEACGLTRVVVRLRQKEQYAEQTVLGFSMPGSQGYPIRIPIFPQAQSYHLDDPPCDFRTVGDREYRVEILLPAEPTQIAVDPDQVLVDKNPANNYWKSPIRWRLTPLYTFLDETDLTNYYDRWNVTVGPWIYSAVYDDPWYPRGTLLGVRAGAYRTQCFTGGVYSAYRTDYRDVVVGADGLWDHWPDSHYQTGFNIEQRLVTAYAAENQALRAAAFERYIIQYGDSLYLPPMTYVEVFAAYQDNFLPFVKNPNPSGERFDHASTAGVHYRLDYRTPYWDPQGGFLVDAAYEGGVAEVNGYRFLQRVTGQVAYVQSLPDLSEHLMNFPLLYGAVRPVCSWLGDTRLAVRVYGGTSMPGRGEFFTLGGSDLYRGFDLSQRQGSTVWVGNLEWRVPLATRLRCDAVDHVIGLRNVYGAAFYDVGDALVNGHSTGPIAHAVGGGIRLDVSWFSFVERTTLRFDVAKTLNANTPTQFWFGVDLPF
jgi:hypothetical protein